MEHLAPFVYCQSYRLAGVNLGVNKGTLLLLLPLCFSLSRCHLLGYLHVWSIQPGHVGYRLFTLPFFFIGTGLRRYPKLRYFLSYSTYTDNKASLSLSLTCKSIYEEESSGQWLNKEMRCLILTFTRPNKKLPITHRWKVWWCEVTHL